MAARKKSATAAPALFQRKQVQVAADGSWIGGADVPSLGGGALLVRGLSSDMARDAFNVKSRMAPAIDRAPDKGLLPSVHARHTREVLSQVCILDARDLPFSADEICAMVLDAGYEDLIIASIAACRAVDVRAQEVEQTEALSGNS